MTSPLTQPLTTPDGVSLTADLHQPDAAPRAAVLLAPALGVRRRFYRPLAAHLAAAGAVVLCPDYRGIGDSRRGPVRHDPATLWDWARCDLPAALTWLSEHHPDVPRRWLGHSLGGQIMGLVPGAECIDRAAFLSSGSGHWRHWPGLRRSMMWALWHGVIPGLSRVLGRLPMRAVGQGEDLPAGVARDWATWGRHPDYVMGVARETRGLTGHADWTGQLRAWAITDDPFVPLPAAQALLAAHAGAERELRVVTPADLGVERVGHFGALRPGVGEPVWDEIADWLTGA